jgi:hypothetical protein
MDGILSAVDSCNMIIQSRRLNRRGRASSTGWTGVYMYRLVHGDRLHCVPVLSEIFGVLGQ